MTTGFEFSTRLFQVPGNHTKYLLHSPQTPSSRSSKRTIHRDPFDNFDTSSYNTSILIYNQDPRLPSFTDSGPLNCLHSPTTFIMLTFAERLISFCSWTDPLFGLRFGCIWICLFFILQVLSPEVLLKALTCSSKQTIWDSVILGSLRYEGRFLGVDRERLEAVLGENNDPQTTTQFRR